MHRVRNILTCLCLSLLFVSALQAATHFRANAGQWHSDIRFGMQAGPASIAFYADGVEWTLRHGGKMQRYRTRFVGVRPDLMPRGEQPTQATIRYLHGGKAPITTGEFAEIRYAEAWPGIDIVYRQVGGQLKYDLEVAAGADPSAVRIALEGIDEATLLPDGQLQLLVAGQIFHEAAPYTFQEKGGEKVEVPSHYRLNAASEIQFELPEGYDAQRPLVIDPVSIEWSTYVSGPIGGSHGLDDFTLDEQGNIFATGASGGGFPMPLGAIDDSWNGNPDAVVYKLDATGSNVIWATYLGGARTDMGQGIELDPAGNVYVTGRTSSLDFPVTLGVVQPTKGDTFGGIDAFVCKIAPDGSTLLYSSYYGGLGDDYPTEIEVNAQGEAFVGGYTNGGFIPTTPGAYDETFNGAQGFSDIFIFRINADASALMYATYIGGTQSESINGMVLNDRDEISFGGEMNSPDWPTSPNALYTRFTGGGPSAFVARISADGSQLQAGSYYSGSGNDYGEGLALNAAGDFYITGRTYSTLLPVTSNAYDTVHNGGIDAFIARISADATTLQYGSFFGGTDREIGTDIEVNDLGEIFLTGITRSNDYPATTCATDSTYNGNSGNYWGGDVFLAKFDSSGERLLYSTLVGGSGDEIIPRIELDSKSCTRGVLLGTTTNSPNYPTTADVFLEQIGGGQGQVHAFTRLTEELDVDIVLPTDSCPTAGTTFDLSAEVKGCGNWTDFRLLEWSFGDGNTARDSATSHTYGSNGLYTVTLRRPGCPDILDQRDINLFGVDLGPDLEICPGQNEVLDASIPGAISYLWYDGKSTATHLVDKSGAIYVDVDDSDGCTASDTVQVTILGEDDVIVPNVFTPNGDGINDKFFVTGLGDAPWLLEVYDRWGKLRYSNTGYQNDWQGSELPEGVYYYILKSGLTCGNFFGNVTLMR